MATNAMAWHNNGSEQCVGKILGQREKNDDVIRLRLPVVTMTCQLRYLVVMDNREYKLEDTAIGNHAGNSHVLFCTQLK